MWGCKKDGASVGAKEADEVVQTNLEVEPEEDLQQEPDQTTEPDTSPPQEQTATQPPEQPEKSEDVFTVKLETTKGDIIIDVHRDWAPLGAERFHELVSVGFYDDVAFFRVIKDFMAQTGVSGKPKLNSKWGRKKIKDEPARKHNMRGNVSFAMAGPNSRTTQFFINLVDNKQLDPMGFAPFGMVRDMTQVDALFSGYGDGPPRGKGPNQQRLKQRGNKYLKKQFPDLDYIISAKIIEE
ncbi:MAG: peptidylprolyl isomerase [Proteobacteria bacterium]|nr:peptidylprolyl isomerase [Pseudomonadota bacterium]